jgi:hypothetical protein
VPALGASAACGGGGATPAVAKVSFKPSASKVSLGAPIDLTYRFDVAPGAAIAGDYLVFLHVKTPDGTRLWGDDHEPIVPTSQWKPGQTVEYTRTRFVPAVAHLGEAIVEIGLYKGADRLPLETADAAGQPNAARSYRVGSFQFMPQAAGTALKFAKGWHGLEFPQDDPAVTWQWSQKTAVLAIRNPRRDATLLLEYDTRPDLAGQPVQQVTVTAAGKPIATFAADSTARVLRRIPITAAQFGTEDAAVLTIDVDRTFVPGKASGDGKDVRELGIRVYHAFLELR